ncbi:hypothetical protein ACMFMG_007515 [Clarireedia jacksonii]
MSDTERLTHRPTEYQSRVAPTECRQEAIAPHEYSEEAFREPDSQAANLHAKLHQDKADYKLTVEGSILLRIKNTTRSFIDSSHISQLCIIYNTVLEITVVVASILAGIQISHI